MANFWHNHVYKMRHFRTLPKNTFDFEQYSCKAKKNKTKGKKIFWFLVKRRESNWFEEMLKKSIKNDCVILYFGGELDRCRQLALGHMTLNRKSNQNRHLFNRLLLIKSFSKFFSKSSLFATIKISNTNSKKNITMTDRNLHFSSYFY